MKQSMATQLSALPIALIYWGLMATSGVMRFYMYIYKVSNQYIYFNIFGFVSTS